VWLAVTPAMLVPFAASLFYFVWLSGRPAGRVIYGAAKLFLLVWPVLATWLVLRERLPRPEPGARRHRRALPAGLMIGAVIVALMLAALHTRLGEVVRSGADAIRERVAAFDALDHYWAFGVGFSLFHALVEEYYWRWFVFGRLCRVVRVPIAHVLAGVAFALHHVVVTAQFFSLGWGLAFGAMVGVGGVIWSVLVRRQGTLAGAWLSHFVVDLGLMFIGYQLLFAG
jgi:hypothetical protein